MYTGAAMAAEEDKLHQQGGAFKRSHMDDNESYQDQDRRTPYNRDTSASDLEDANGLGSGTGSADEGDTQDQSNPMTAVEVNVMGLIPSLGTGVIEDYSSFSPFKSPFTSSVQATATSAPSSSSASATAPSRKLI